MDRKLDLLVSELRRYGVSVAAIQETKWFGKDVWQADRHTFLHSGRPLPKDGEPAVRNEGVGILLDERATAAWKEAGEVWNAISSRIVTARLKLVGAGQRKPGGSREKKNTYLSVVCVYAPTAKAPPGVAQKFTEDLQDTVDKIPTSDVLLLLGDFNARVGCSVAGDVWRGVRGRHGVGCCNEAGEKFLEFCAVNQFTIMSTWFVKKSIHLATWKHPATKQSHMIDYVVMRAEQRMLCTDVQVMRGASCWSDHHMVRVKVRVGLPRQQKQRTTLPFAVHTLHCKEQRKAYQQALEEQLRDHPIRPDKSTEHNWNTLKNCILTAAEAIVGRGRKKQPDWFVKAADTLQPLLDAKKRAHEKVLQLDNIINRREFRKHQRTVKCAVDAAKEEWISELANIAEKARKDGKQRWTCIRQLQMTHAGRRPTRPTAMWKENGEVTRSPEEVKQRWHDHFNNVLNVPSQYRQETIDEIPFHPTEWELDDPPTCEELTVALSKLKKGKAGGKTGIMPELIVHGGAELIDRLLQLIQHVWQEGTVVEDWRDAEIVPIPKKGNLKLCDNWRGISLLDVAGKVFARILQERLQKLAEKVLPESQCGFRKGRGCVDMIFAARQLLEKCREHDDALFVLFIDLKKAYDSVPRDALWGVLRKCGVPPTMLSVIRSFHDGMLAQVRVGGDLTTNSIEVKNGVRQGCTLAPSLFNIYFSAMVACWRARCPEAGVTVRYKHGRKLVGDRTAKSHLSEVRITESQFADDAAVYASTRAVFERTTSEFVKAASEWGLTVNIQKTKGMIIGQQMNASDSMSVELDSGSIEIVQDFTYLGSNITCDGEVQNEVKIRISKAARAFGCLQKSIFQDRRLSVETKRRVYEAAVLSVLLYGAETWSIKAESVRRLSGFHNRCIRTIMGVTKQRQWRERISSRQLAADFGMEETMAEILMKHRLRWLGHLARMESHRMPKQLLFGELQKKRPSHGTKRRWRDVAAADIKSVNAGAEWYDLAQDRNAWAAVCKEGIESLVDQHQYGTYTANLSRLNRAGSYPCPCGRSFRRKGDRTRHSHFCGSAIVAEQ